MAQEYYDQREDLHGLRQCGHEKLNPDFSCPECWSHINKPALARGVDRVLTGTFSNESMGRPEPPTFDQRPGEFEATRGLVLAECKEVPGAVCGRDAEDGWGVLLLADGRILARMTAKQAMQLSHDLLACADICERGFRV